MYLRLTSRCGRLNSCLTLDTQGNFLVRLDAHKSQVSEIPTFSPQPGILNSIAAIPTSLMGKRLGNPNLDSFASLITEGLGQSLRAKQASSLLATVTGFGSVLPYNLLGV